jgi:hypothetical protein
MQVSKPLLSLFFTCACILYANAQSFEPENHSGKWVEGREMSILEKDSINVKINFRRTFETYLIFEIEILNQSTTKEILVDPTLFEGKWQWSSNSSKIPLHCENLAFLDQSYKGFDDYFQNTNAEEKVLKKHTLQPQKSILGYLIIKHCNLGKTSMDFKFPIAGSIFRFKFSDAK